MKLFLIASILILVSTLNTVRSAPKALSAAGDKCFHSATQHSWPVGQEYRPVGQCALIKCTAGGQMSSLTCPLVQPPPDKVCTKQTVDLTKAYPTCCPQYKCV